MIQKLLAFEKFIISKTQKCSNQNYVNSLNMHGSIDDKYVVCHEEGTKG